MRKIIGEEAKNIIEELVNSGKVTEINIAKSLQNNERICVNCEFVYAVTVKMY